MTAGTRPSHMPVERLPGEKRNGRKTIPVKRSRTGDRFAKLSPGAVDLLENPDQLDSWDDEELMWGTRRHPRTGKLPTRLPNFIPAKVHQELTKRVMSRARHRFAAELEYAIKAHCSIIRDVTLPAIVRLRAIDMLYDRVFGKAAQPILLSTDADDLPWKKMMSSAIVATEEQAEEVRALAALPEGEVLEGEILEEEDPEEGET